MRIVFRKMGFRALRKRFQNEVVLAALIACVFTFILCGIFLFQGIYDALYNSEIQQCYEVFQDASVESGWDWLRDKEKWYESKAIRINTGRYRYQVEYLPYRAPVRDMVDEMDSELPGKKILIQYKERLWLNRGVVGIEYNGKVYIDPQESLAIWEKRMGIRDAILSAYILADLLILLPMTFGFIKIERKKDED